MAHSNLTKISLFVFSILICIISFSCKSSNYTETQQNENVQDTLAQTDINESKEDLMTVDYKQFYDELAPHGKWIEVTAADLKSDEQPTSAGEDDELDQILKDRSSSFPKVTFGQLFGVNDAVAADVNAEAFFVWRPDPSMAVSISTGVPVVESEPTVVAAAPVYRPYTNGQWIATDEGWYFKAPTPHEEIVHHYGRWAYSPAMGWVWVPGRVRSPAWVDWREDEDNIAWTPVPPDVYVVNNVIEPVPVYEDRYVVVEKRYFVEPVVTQYVYVDRIKVKKMKHLHGLYVRDRVLYNRGPEFVEIERFSGRPIAPYKVVTMNEGFKNTWIENNSINTFAPVFTKVKVNKNRNVAVTQPEKFNKFVEVWNRENRNNSAGRTEDIGKQNKANEKLNDKFEKQNEQKQLKENKQNEKREKVFDDSDMKTGKKKEKFEQREKNKDNGNKKVKKEKQRKEVKEKKDKPDKDMKREKSPDRPKKEKKDSKSSGDNKKQNENPKGNKHDKPKRDKR